MTSNIVNSVTPKQVTCTDTDSDDGYTIQGTEKIAKSQIVNLSEFKKQHSITHMMLAILKIQIL